MTKVIKEISTDLANFRQIPEILQHMVGSLRDLKLAKFRYSASIASRGSNSDFKKKLAQAYSPVGHPTSTLMDAATGVYMPSQIVIGSHLFKHAWLSEIQAEVDVQDIDDTKNGLLMWKPVELAFDDSRLCIEVDSNQQYTWRLLDIRWKATKLEDVARSSMGKSYQPAPSHLSSMTYGDLDRNTVHFATTFRPFKRILAFHATWAEARARREWPQHVPKGLVLAKHWSNMALPAARETSIEDWVQTLPTGNTLGHFQIVIAETNANVASRPVST